MSKGLRESFRLMRRSPYQAFAAIFVLWLTFLLAYVLSFLLYGSERVLGYFETRPQVVAFFKASAELSKIQEIAQDFSQKTYVSSVKVTTKDDALALYRKENEKDPMLLDLVTADVLPASLEVSANDPDALPQIREDFGGYAEFVDEVVFQKDFVESLTQWTRGIRVAGLIIVGTLALSSVIVLTVLIGMKVTMKRKEVGIMRLLGATDGYIFSPFLLEGAVYGSIGALLAWITAYTIVLYATPTIIQFMGDIPLIPIPLELYGIQVGVGVFSGFFLGICSSLIALRRIAR